MNPGPAGKPGRTFAPVIRTQADLEAAWRELMQPLGFRRTSVWLMMLQADGVPLPQLVEVADCPPTPTRDDADQLAAMLAHLPPDDGLAAGGPGGRWALLRSRPGGAAIVADDRVWAATVTAACAAQGVALAPLHVASDEDIRPLPLDELRAAS